MSKIWTDEEKLKEFGTTDDKEIMEILNYREEIEKENQKLADEAYDEMVRQGLIKEENYGYYEDEDGNEEYDENLKELDTINTSIIKKVKENEKVKEKLYLKDDIKEGFEVAVFDSLFKKDYGNIKERDFKIYYYLRHHLSYNRNKLIEETFSKEINCIKNFMEIEEIVYNFERGEYFFPYLNSYKNYTDTFDTIRLEVKSLFKILKDYNIHIYHNKPIYFKSDFQLVHDDKVLEPVRNVYNQIKFTSKNNYFDILAKIISKDNDEHYQKAISICLYHWMWKIKYKIKHYLNLPCKLKDYSDYEPIAPVLYGDQGVGKSVLINKLIEPLQVAGLAQNTSTKKLFESYTYDLISKYFIIILDDLSTIRGDDVPDFKDMISGKSRTGRQKGDQTSKTFKTRASFILGSNIPVNEVIDDPSGNRRFFQINIKKSYEEIQKRNFIALWKTVDENSDPISKAEFDKYLQPYQKVLKTKTKYEEFISDMGLEFVNKQTFDINRENYFMIQPTILYNIYSHWLGFKIDRVQTIKNINKTIGMESFRFKKDGITYNMYFIKKDGLNIEMKKLIEKYNK